MAGAPVIRSARIVVGWYGVKIDAARVVEDADQNMGHHGPYVIAGHELTQRQALGCAYALLLMVATALAILLVSCTRPDTGIMGGVSGLDCTHDAGLPVVIMECRAKYSACADTCPGETSSIVYAHSWTSAEACFEEHVIAFVGADSVTWIGCIPVSTLEPGQRPNGASVGDWSA